MDNNLKPQYKEPVKFSVTNTYGCGPEDEDDVYTIAEWLEHVRDGSFIDYDGYGHLVKDGKADPQWIRPSMVEDETFNPFDATHIVWLNR
jgi:hypothetical protein